MVSPPPFDVKMEHAVIDETEVPEMCEHEFVVTREQHANGDHATGEARHRAPLRIDIGKAIEQMARILA